MLYQKRSFTVPASAKTGPENCAHGWTDKWSRCVLCGVKVAHWSDSQPPRHTAIHIDGLAQVGRAPDYRPVSEIRDAYIRTSRNKAEIVEVLKRQGSPISDHDFGPQNGSQEPE